MTIDTATQQQCPIIYAVVEWFDRLLNFGGLDNALPSCRRKWVLDAFKMQVQVSCL
jgi:hypothetical protein